MSDSLAVTRQAVQLLDQHNTSLVIAIKQKNWLEAKRLLEQGADPNVREIVVPKPTADDPPEGKTSYRGDTVLMLAIEA